MVNGPWSQRSASVGTVFRSSRTQAAVALEQVAHCRPSPPAKLPPSWLGQPRGSKHHYQRANIDRSQLRDIHLIAVKIRPAAIE